MHTEGDATDIPSANPAAIANRHPNFCFDDSLVAIQIENTIFNVHKYQLMESTTFSDMFAIGNTSNNNQTAREGSSLDCPIAMKGVSATDFECLMTVLYAKHFSDYHPKPEFSLIAPAFRLASMWNFGSVCAHLKSLAERALDHADKIVFAREFGFTEWLAPAHTKLCLRQEKLTPEEASKLGLESLFFISQYREKHQIGSGYKSAHCPSCGYTRCRSCKSTQLEPVIPAPPWEEKTQQEVQAWVDKGCGL
ncbi:hypothetical protein FRC12_006371 [Ceratobasidium sp. 428]|nr:hypothetical protein FRC12_006371 [Ceratobasidium sp. 428]